MPITEYASTRAPAITERLQLFLDVCSAVEYAHQHFVVHRDIKPGNILISDSGVAKLLDFGICKLLHNEIPAAETASGTLRMLTPDYASPSRSRRADYDYSDIYSLEAVLYELLTGFKPHRIEKLTPQAVERAICEYDLVRPSLVPDKGLAPSWKATWAHSVARSSKGPAAPVCIGRAVIRRYSPPPVTSTFKARPDTLVYRVRKFAAASGTRPSLPG